MLLLFFFATLTCIFFIVFYFRIPAAGFYNKDDIPDFLVRYNTGIGFPVYFYSNVSWSASVKKIIVITFLFSIILKPLLPTITSLHFLLIVSNRCLPLEIGH